MSSIIKASFWLTLSELAFNLSGYITHSFLGRFLGPAEYGRYSLVITFSTMVVVLVGRGVPVAMSKYLSEVRKNPPLIKKIKFEAAKTQALIIAPLTLVYFLAAPFFSRALNDSSLTSLFRVSSLVIPAFALASFYFYYYTGIHAFTKQAFLKFNRAFAKLFFILSLGYLFGTMGALIGHAIAPFTVFLDAYFIDPFRKIKKVNQEIVQKFNFSKKKLLQFAWPIIVFMIFYEVMVSVDLYLVKAILKDDRLAGLYSAALTVGRIPFYAFYFLTIILLPKISETTSQKMDQETQRILKTAMRFLMMLLWPAVALLAAFAPSAVRFFYGARYSEAGTALSILSLGMGFLTIFYILAFVLNGAGKNKIPMKITMGGAVLNASLGYLLISHLGILGAAWATTLTAFIAMLLSLIVANKKIVPFWEPTSYLKFLLFSTAVFWLASNFFPQGRFVFILWSSLLFLFYLILLFVAKEISKEDCQFFLASLKKKK